MKKLVTMILAVAMLVTLVPLGAEEAGAATLAPAQARINSAVVSGNTVTLKWGKTARATTYQLGLRSAAKKWVPYMTVRKNTANKKRYTVSGLYKVTTKNARYYTVHRYQYTYSNLRNTKSLSYKWTGFAYNTKYNIGLRAGNGKTYSGWTVITRTTGAKPPVSKVVTTNGVSQTLTVGKACVLNVQQIQGVPTELKQMTIVPSKIMTYASGSCDIHGKKDGLDLYYTSNVKNPNNTCYGAVHPTFNAGNKQYELFPTGLPWYAEVKNSNVKIVWTLDGTEPKLGQADKTVAGSEYPFGTLYTNGYEIEKVEKIKTRGTVSKGEPVTIFSESKGGDNIGTCVWIKVYNGTSVVEEGYMCYGPNSGVIK